MSGSLATLVADNAGSDGSFADAKPITIGGSEWRSIFPASDEDYFQFSAASDPGGSIIDTTTGDGVCALDTVLYLYDSTCNQVAYNDNGGTSPCSRIVVPAGLIAGTYFVRVKAYSAGHTGAYRLSVSNP